MDPNEIIDIQPKDNLLRRSVYPNPPTITLIKDDGTICSSCFHLRKDEDGLSVNIERLSTYDEAVVDRSKYRLIHLNAGEVQKLGLNTLHSPEPDNYSHALIKGVKNKKMSKKLARISTLLPLPGKSQTKVSRSD